jgi:voltage-gated potassium channel
MSIVATQTVRARLLRTVGGLVAAVLFYYFVPLPDQPSSAARVLAFLVGLCGLVVLILQQVRQQLRAPENDAVRLNTLIVLLYLVVVFFSLTYVQIERLSPGQFVDLQTRTDALYFTIATLGTVGFGDVHPDGQLARTVVTTQIVFDLVFVAALISVFSHRIHQVVAAHRIGTHD